MQIGKVVRVLSPYEVVVNLGSMDGISESTRFLIYSQGDEITDPETLVSLGALEVVHGRGRAKHVQERMTTVRTDETKIVRRERSRPIMDPLRMSVVPRFEHVTEDVKEPAEFENVAVGTLARTI